MMEVFINITAVLQKNANLLKEHNNDWRFWMSTGQSSCQSSDLVLFFNIYIGLNYFFLRTKLLLICSPVSTISQHISPYHYF